MGDGLTGTGAGDAQIFQVPPGATRLFLGVHDAGPPNTAVPGWYGDNSGIIRADVELTAAPLSAPGLPPWGLLTLAALLVGASRRLVRMGRRSG